MGSTRDVVLRLIGDPSALRRAYKTAEGDTKAFERKVEQSVEKSGKKLVSRGKAMSLGLTVPALAFLKSSATAFGESERASTELSTALENNTQLAGTTADEMKDLASAIQDKTLADDESVTSGIAVLANFKLTEEQIRRVIPLVVDYARRTGQDVPTAAGAIGKAALGNTRALKELGVNYKTTGNQVEDFANIVDLIAGKVGGFAEKEAQQGGAALTRMSNKFNDLQEKVGAAVVPVMEKLLTVAVGLFEMIDALPGPIKGFIGALFGVGIVVGPLMIVVGKIRLMRIELARARLEAAALGGPKGLGGIAGVGGKLKGLAGSVKSLGTAFAGVGVVLAGIAVAIGSVAVAWNHLRKQQDVASQTAANATRAYVEGQATLEDLSAAVQDASKWLGTNADEWLGLARNQAIAAAQARAAEGDIDGVNDVLARAQLLMMDGRQAITAADAAQIFADVMKDDFVPAAKDAAGEIGDLNRKNQEQRALWEENTDAVSDFNEVLNRQLNPLINTQAANDRYREAVEALTQSLKENGRSTDNSTEKGRKNRAAIRDVISAAEASVTAFAENTDAVESNAEMNQMLRDRLEALKKKFPGLRGEIQAYINKLGKIPPKKNTDVTANTAQAQAALDKILETARRISGARFDVNFSNPDADKPRARGGNVEPGVAYTINEGDRAEGVMFGQPGRVFSNADLQRASTGGSASIDVDALADAVSVGVARALAGMSVQIDGQEAGRILAAPISREQGRRLHAVRRTGR